MKIVFRLVLLVCLLAVALTMVTLTLAGFRGKTAAPTGQLLLAAYEGSVAVFDSGDRKTPLQITDIPLSALRETDRKSLEQGVAVASEEELMTLLEDLGS